MNIHPMCLVLLAGGISTAVTVTSSAALLVNFNTGTLIDQSGGDAVDAEASGATPETTLEAFSGLRVLNDFRQSTDPVRGGSFLPSGGDNTFAFDDVSHPDIFIDQQTNARSNSGAVSGGGNGTSPAEGMNIINNALAPVTFSIDFGSFDFGADGVVGGGDDSFNADVVYVNAAGFTVSDIRDNQSITATFFGTDGSVISVQSATNDPASPTKDIYFGLIDQTNGISSISVTRTSGGTAEASVLADLAFGSAITIPEPASLVLLSLGGMCLLPRRSRA